MSQLESLRNVIGAERAKKSGISTAGSAVPVMERNSADNVYVNVYSKPAYYLEKCFPTLFPYGRGGPGDVYYSMKSWTLFFRHVLRRGGGKDGRRFQNNPGFIFVAYTYETKRRVGNMSYAATRNESEATTKLLTSQAVVSSLVECLSEATEDEPLDIDKLYQRAKEAGNVSNMHNVGGVEGLISEAEMVDQLKRLLQRLVPFAKQASGTTLHMKYERANMMQMIVSAFILAYADWRWFTTFAHPDKQDSRLYENVVPDGCDLLDWCERESIVCTYDSSTRARLLRDHPALVARIFHEKQECIWNYILMGSDNPVGRIEEYMRRVEVIIYFFTTTYGIIMLVMLCVYSFVFSSKREVHHTFMR